MFLSPLPQTELGGKIVVFAVLLKDLFRRYLTGLAKLRRKSRTRHILKFIRLIASLSGYFAPYLRQICRRITRERQNATTYRALHGAWLRIYRFAPACL